MPPPGVSNGSIRLMSAGSSSPKRIKRWAPLHGAGRRHDKPRPGGMVKRPLGWARWKSRPDSMSPQSMIQQTPSDMQASQAIPQVSWGVR